MSPHKKNWSNFSMIESDLKVARKVAEEWAGRSGTRADMGAKIARRLLDERVEDLTCRERIYKIKQELKEDIDDLFYEFMSEIEVGRR